MKRTLLFLTAILSYGETVAQAVFCPEGAHWEYYHDGFMGDPWNPIISNSWTYVGDTIIEGANAKELHLVRQVGDMLGNTNGGFTFSESSTYITRNSDSILVWAENQWEFVFDLGVEVGDTNIVYVGEEDGSCVSHDTIVIDSVWTYDYQGVPLKAFDYHILWEDWSEHPEYPFGRYVERLGFLGDSPVDPKWCHAQTVDYVPAQFFCYHDTELLSDGIIICDLNVSVAELRDEMAVEIIQQNTEIVIRNGSNSTLRIYDILGKEHYNSTVRSDNEVIDITQLPNGILMVVVEGKAGRLSKKIVKTRTR